MNRSGRTTTRFDMLNLLEEPGGRYDHTRRNPVKLPSGRRTCGARVGLQWRRLSAPAPRPRSHEVTMDFDLPREVRLVRKSVREFAEQVVAPLVEEMEQRDEFPAALVRQLGRPRRPRPRHAGRARRLEPRLPGPHGGRRGGEPRLRRGRPRPAGPPHGRGGASPSSARRSRSGRTSRRSAAATTSAPARSRSRPAARTSLGMVSTARPVADGYVLNGRKCFITNCHLSDAVVTVAKTGEGPKGLSAFVVEKSTARVLRRPARAQDGPARRRTPGSWSSATATCRARACSATRATG